MSREIKFRIWSAGTNAGEMIYLDRLNLTGDSVGWADDENGNEYEFSDKCPLMQFTGLHDKNSLKELYEGDIIDADGKLKGNIYESPQIYQEGIDCLIEGMGTEAWRNTESIAMGRGCRYSKQ